MNKLEDIKLLGGTGAAQQMYKEGQGQSDNPFSYASDEHQRYAIEMSRLQQQELYELMGMPS